jgi:surfeit locus 1 family protein
MKLIAFNRYWVLRWYWLLVCTAGFSLLVGLSFWQLQRAHTKELLLERLSRFEQSDALDYEQLVATEIKAVDGLRVDFKAQWVAPIVWLLDNQTYQGQMGYDVVVPAMITGQEKILLVNLGWVAAPPRREQLPRVKVPVHLHIQGVVRTEFGGLLLGQNLENNQRWPMRLQQLDIKTLTPFLQQPLFPGLVHQQQNSPFQLHYQAVVLSPERHRAYAVQWALLALVLLVVAVLASGRKVVDSPKAD